MGCVTPSSPFLAILGRGGAPHPAHRPGATSAVGHGRRIAGGSLVRPRGLFGSGSSVSRPPPEPRPWEKAARGRGADSSPCTRAPGLLPNSCPPAKGLWRPLQLAAASPPGAGLSRGIPRGALHLHGDRVGRAAPRLPRLGPVSQGPLEDHPEGLPQPL